MWDDYVWIVVVGAFMAFFTAYGIGANDVANTFAIPVGSKALTITQAVFIAAFFEFVGAVLFGSQATDSVPKKIADREEFEDDPEIFMYGMLCVLAATGIWLTLASFLELPVSTTQSLLGGIVGMTLAFKGSDAVVWYEYDSSKSSLNKFKGVAPVIASWVISPFLAGCFAAIFFFGIRACILRHADSEKRVLMFHPLLVILMVAINVYFIVYKGFNRTLQHNGKKQKVKDILGGWTHLLAWGMAVVSAGSIWFVSYLKKKIREARQYRLIEMSTVQENGVEEGENETEEQEAAVSNESAAKWNAASFFDHDVHDVIQHDQTVNKIHETSEEFDQDTEEAFKSLQSATAMFESFVHGADDLANSLSPFASIFMVYRKESTNSKASVPVWILILGGVGIVTRLATYGYNIIRAIGVKLIKITPSRGFSIKRVSLWPSRSDHDMVTPCYVRLFRHCCVGIPLSTTHCQIGAIVGVGLLEGKRGVNLRLLAKVIGGWIITLFVVGGTAAAFFAQGAYAPSIINARIINRYENGLIDISERIGSQLNIDEATNEEIIEDKNDDSKRQSVFVKDLVDQLIKNRTA